MRIVVFCAPIVVVVSMVQTSSPLAPEQYKNIQVLADVPARQILSTMDYFTAATSFGCGDCHQRGKPGEPMPFEVDTPRKGKARDMVRMVKAFNAAGYGVTINCATCHAGHTRPPGIEMMTPDRFATIVAARGTGPAPPAATAATPSAPEPAPPAVDAVLARYFDAIGGRAAVERLTSTLASATLQNVGTTQTANVTIDRHNEKLLVSIQVPPSTQAQRMGFDGANTWMSNGTTVMDLPERTFQKICQLTTLGLSSRVLSAYTNLKAERSQTLRLTATATPIAVNVLTASFGPDVTERWYFDASTGLLVRRVFNTRVALGGAIEEWIDYGDYQLFGSVKVPHVLTQTTSSIITTITLKDITAPTANDDGRFVRPKIGG